MPSCRFCGKEIVVIGRVLRQDVCPACRRDLHACAQCRFHDPGYHNKCREPKAEMVRERERSNQCDYFEIAPDRQAGEDVNDARRKLEDLFK